MDNAPRGRCGEEGCREKRFYLDNGLWFCRRGHLQQGFQQVAHDEADFGIQLEGKIHRVKTEKHEIESQKFRGRRAATLFLQAFQLILWKQCHALVKDHGFPEQLETIVRDLWALRLRGYNRRIIDKPGFDDDNDDDYDDDEPRLFSSQPSSADSGNESSDEELWFKPEDKPLMWPRVMDGVGLCYMAAILMRLPICVVDFHRLIVRQEIPYVRAIRHVPNEMRNHLPKMFFRILDHTHIPSPERFHWNFIAQAALFRNNFGIQLPPLNSPLVLYRHIKRLAVPIDIFDTVKTLQSIVGFKYEYPDWNRETREKQILHLPELQIVVLIVIATKLLFPFDGLKRSPGTTKEPAAQVINWDQWAKAQRNFREHEGTGSRVGAEKIIDITDKDIPNMNVGELDQYMDWYEKKWLDNVQTTNPIADMFSPSRPEATHQPNVGSEPSSGAGLGPDEALSALIKSVMVDIKAPSVKPGKKDMRPGSRYVRYRFESQLPDAARVLYEVAARLASVSLKSMITAVASVESRISTKIENKQLRQNEIGEEEEEEEEEGEEEEEEEEEEGVGGEQEDATVAS
ncbi:hypothetical protein N7532_010682 [Penicillium argentinense]|uniref:RRN7-type domain-containing protein n=1 Tax=Penicillium argentinense TaxID=1131581 RepID=A0A9W9EQ56_9EURO|nr:uncharacterized protein N7532_010682 [Penicillium argentinense]KAJ5085911.1 hypothetical protein N7532_010682 [Penicillium argentinense]